ncbi:type IV pilus assembly protein PilP [Thioploca ingrica]|uniref:Type IV pilus assembly protein PilP n=1 Tax=Thioploca ingrica TaxID=40754 RepID=A0A090AKV0_9GAMM|nr:type IV pilus assembly protein PilP [Thioploca ingrica]
MITHPNLYSYYLSCIGLLALLLNACSDSNQTDLEEYVDETQKAGNPHVDPLPPIEPISNYFYEPNGLRDPFEPIMPTELEPPPPPPVPCRPLNINRVRTGLELMPLDALTLSGTIETKDSQGHPTLWALVESKSDPVTIYRVKQGDYMGNNYGQIINISNEKIEVLEQIPDTESCWQENLVTISLLADQ